MDPRELEPPESSARDGEGEATEAATTRVWRKALWLKQEFPDNYVDSTFLESLQRNVDVRSYSYPSLVYATLPISQHCASTLAFVAVFNYLYRGDLRPQVLIWGCVGVGLAGYVGWERAGRGYQRASKRLSTLLSSFSLLSTLLLLSPVLKTLTKATTSDSIWALSVALLTVNAVLGDYGTESDIDGSARFPSALSLNAAISASVVLASRLKENLEVFAIMFFSVICFALFPILRKEIRRNAKTRDNIILTLSTWTLTLVLLIPISTIVCLIYVTALMGITFGCPLALVWMQRYKDEIRGPWDEAIPKIK